MRNIGIGICAIGLTCSFAGVLRGGEPVAFFRLDEVRLLDGPFQRARDLDHQYLLALEPDRLLSGFRSEAGLEPRAPKYPNWESSGLDGHVGGHYLTAVAQMWAATGDAEMKRRLDYMVAELAECQLANGNGYVGAVPHSRELWTDIAAGKFDAQGFALRNAWVPWYNVHKTFAGLRDSWLIAGNSQARDVLIRLADWCAGILAGFTDEQVQQMLRAEHGGMNEVLADVSAITGDARYLEVARRFSHRAVLDPLLRHEDRLTGLHANTQIPKVVGFARIAELGDDAAWHEAAAYFWETVVARRSVAFGGNSVREHFNPPDDFSGLLESREGPESCNTYNMLRLTEHLFRRDPAARYGDYYERALFNHILSTQHPEHGGFVYFTPIRPQHYRVYSQPTKCFWCCVGSGIENHGKHGRFIYARADDTLFVNLFIASEVVWRERGVNLRQETNFPDEPRTRLVVAVKEPATFTLRVRHPGWLAGDAMSIKVNGEAVANESAPSSYASITRLWRDGDRVDIALPMRTTFERLPDGSDHVALLHGPILLATRTDADGLEGLIAGDARMGHIAPGPYRPLDGAPMLVGDVTRIDEFIAPVADRPLTFTARELIRPERFRELELQPFFRVHDTRYVIYWRTVSPDQYDGIVTALKATEAQRFELERRTVDQVTPGEQQPEKEHNFRGADTASGSSFGRAWREGRGWFSYDLSVAAGEPLELRVTTFGRDRNSAFSILVNDREIATVNLTGDAGEQFVESIHPIPADALATSAESRATIKFLAQADSRIAPIYEIRVARAAKQ